MTTATHTFQLVVTAPAQTGTPAWFTGLSPLTWLPIADGSGATGTGGARLDQVTYSGSHVWPTGYVGKPGAWGSPTNYTQNSNGAAVDPVNAEMFIAANGGHGGYMGNETMRLRLRTATPAWERFIESTPPDYTESMKVGSAYVLADGQTNGTLSYHCYEDGPAHTLPTSSQPNSAITRRPASMHTSCLPTYSNGKVWFALQNSSNLNGGTSALAKIAVNVDAVRGNSALAAWEFGRLAPWEFHGVMTDVGALSQGSFLFSGSALDESTGRLWTPFSGNSLTTRYLLMTETTGPNAGRHQFFRNATTFQVGGGNMPQIITVTNTSGQTRKLLVTMATRNFDAGTLTRRVITADLTTIEALNIPYSGEVNISAVTQHTVNEPAPLRWHSAEVFAEGKDPAGTWGPGPGWGFVYHAPSKAFLAFNCDHSVNSSRVRSGALRKLSLPVNAQGQYDPTNFQWTWTEVPIAGPVPTTCLPDGYITGGSWSKFNIVRQFDGTNDLLIALNSWNTATSVMKLPPAAV